MTQPKLLTRPWAEHGLKNNIPLNREGSEVTSATATYEDGFPEVTMKPINEGGKAPSGKDMNGILHELSSHIIYANKGNFYQFEDDFCQSIEGYPKGAVLISDDRRKLFISLINNNKTNFNWEDYKGKWDSVFTTSLLSNPDGFKFIGQCESIEQLRTIRPTEHGQRILVKSYYAGGTTGGGEFMADLQDLVTPDDGGACFVVEGNGGRWKRIHNQNYININDFGATGESVDIDTKAISKAAEYSSGGLPLFIPYAQIEFKQYTNVRGCKIIGSNTYVSGGLRGYTELDQIFIAQKSQQNHYHIESTAEEPTVGVYRSLNGEKTFVLVPKNGNLQSAVMFEFIKDFATTTNSLGGGQELIRAANTHNLSYAAFYYHNGKTQGTWRNRTRWQEELLPYKGKNYQQLSYIQGEYNSSVEFNLAPSSRDYTNLAYISSVGSSEIVEIYVNGSKLKEINAKSDIYKLKVIKIDIDKHQENLISIKVKNQGVLNLVGINYDDINQLSADVQYNDVFSLKPALTHYITNAGANDYAIFELGANLWGGSYHGGETLLSGQMIDLSNQQLTINNGEYKAIAGLKLLQDTRINFSRRGGTDIDISSITSFCYAGIEFLGTMRSNKANIRHLFTAMNCVGNNFSRILFPHNATIDSTGELDLTLGNHNKVIYFDDAAKSIVVNEFSLYPTVDSDRGGVYINPAPNAYNKLYYGHFNGEQVIDNFAFSSRRIFK